MNRVKYSIIVDDKQAVKAIKRITKALQELKKETVTLNIKSEIPK